MTDLFVNDIISLNLADFYAIFQKKLPNIDIMKNSFVYEAFHDREKPLRCFYSTDANTRPHFHRCIEMLYITQGKAEGIVDGTHFFAEKDDIVFARRCAVHSYFARPHYHDIVIIVKEAYADDFSPALEKATLPKII